MAGERVKVEARDGEFETPLLQFPQMAQRPGVAGFDRAHERRAGATPVLR